MTKLRPTPLLPAQVFYNPLGDRPARARSSMDIDNSFLCGDLVLTDDSHVSCTPQEPWVSPFVALAIIKMKG